MGDATASTIVVQIRRRQDAERYRGGVLEAIVGIGAVVLRSSWGSGGRAARAIYAVEHLTCAAGRVHITLGRNSSTCIQPTRAGIEKLRTLVARACPRTQHVIINLPEGTVKCSRTRR
jgi:hypothetical protein